jgi:hypothetical protein
MHSTDGINGTKLLRDASDNNIMSTTPQKPVAFEVQVNESPTSQPPEGLLKRLTEEKERYVYVRRRKMNACFYAFNEFIRGSNSEIIDLDNYKFAC